MRYTNILTISLIFCFLFNGCNNGLFEKDPRLVEHHNTKLLLGGDTIFAKELKLLPFKGDTIRYARVSGLDKDSLRTILSFVLKQPFEKKLLAADLYIEYGESKIDNWNIFASEIKNLSIFYIENDSLKFGFYNLDNKTFKTYERLSSTGCGIPLMFLLNESDVNKNPGLILLSLRDEDIPKQSDVILVSKDLDSLNRVSNEFLDTFILDQE